LLCAGAATLSHRPCVGLSAGRVWEWVSCGQPRQSPRPRGGHEPPGAEVRLP
jgi:hypothetical protein